MIFPYDVNKVVVNSKKIAGQNKVQAVILAFILGSIGLFWFTDSFVNSVLGAGLGVTFAIDGFILIIVGTLIFRFVIFDEDLKKREYEGAESDSFAKYLYLRKDIHTDLIVGSEQISVFEFINGSTMAMLEFRFGSNDDVKAEQTRLLYEKLLQTAGMYGIETRYIVTQENFRNSQEFRRHIGAINKIKDKKMARNVMVINDAIMEESCKQGNVDVVYFMMRTIGRQRSDLELVIKSVFSALTSSTSAFRSIHFLDAEELMEFYREFYRIAAIDLSMMRTIELSQQLNEEFQNVVTINQLQAVSGKIYKFEQEVSFLQERKMN